MTIKQKKPSLSIAIITRNEAKNIGRCLESVKWADEIIVVDSGSTDNTLDIAKQYGAKTFHHDWLGFGPQKNKAIAYCQSDWILVLDADEVVTKELNASIQQAITQSHPVYQFKRRSQFGQRWINHGDWGRDIITRLFKKGSARCSDDPIHEYIASDTPARLISGQLNHYTHEKIEDSWEKLNRYTNLTAELLFKKGRKSHVFQAILHEKWTFFRSYILRRGFLDGSHGYLLAKLSAYGAFLKYIKLREKNASNEKRQF